MAQWNPLHDLVTLQDRMNRFFEDATQRRASEAIRAMRLNGLIGIRRPTFTKRNDEYVVAVDFPASIEQHLI